MQMEILADLTYILLGLVATRFKRIVLLRPKKDGGQKKDCNVFFLVSK